MITSSVTWTSFACTQLTMQCHFPPLTIFTRSSISNWLGVESRYFPPHRELQGFRWMFGKQDSSRYNWSFAKTLFFYFGAKRLISEKVVKVKKRGKKTDFVHLLPRGVPNNALIRGARFRPDVQTLNLVLEMVTFSYTFHSMHIIRFLIFTLIIRIIIMYIVGI